MLVIGDVHGDFDSYFGIINQHKESIQIGDFGLQYPEIPSGHKFFMGNHDNYSVNHPNCLGDFGAYKHVFFIRGAKTIDPQGRIFGVDLFPNEELNWYQASKMLNLYLSLKPDIVLSHDCPTSVKKYRYPHFEANYTNNLLQIALDIHRPKRWIFGHHHENFTYTAEGTTFQCLAPLSYTYV